MMEIILNEYNKFDAKPISTIQELEGISEIVHSEIVRQTNSEIVFKRFCVCCARDRNRELHPVHYFIVDMGKLDANGDVDDELITVECGLL